ncbi:hypothetical protein EVAR_5069_1 [Eumeta japonica]|uniref:Uncharacterized protein n=1 Tax=Eumeta variegata TaxID=151549 RepID=A0A4C1SX48_EUMVA|nr:hypothetical protein EVAR_5069_1 [Eumeta japonica]
MCGARGRPCRRARWPPGTRCRRLARAACLSGVLRAGRPNERKPLYYGRIKEIYRVATSFGIINTGESVHKKSGSDPRRPAHKRCLRGRRARRRFIATRREGSAASAGLCSCVFGALRRTPRPGFIGRYAPPAANAAAGFGPFVTAPCVKLAASRIVILVHENGGKPDVWFEHIDTPVRVDRLYHVAATDGCECR